MKAPSVLSKDKSLVPVPGYAAVSDGIFQLLNAARLAAARNVNALMTASYWEIGRRIVEAEQKGKRRAGYGEQLIERLSLDLTRQFGRGFSHQNLWQMRLFFHTWGPERILQTVSGEFKIAPTTSAAYSLAQLSQAFPLPWPAMRSMACPTRSWRRIIKPCCQTPKSCSRN